MTIDFENTHGDNPVVCRFQDNELHASCEITCVDFGANGSVCRLDMRAKDIYIGPRVIMEE